MIKIGDGNYIQIGEWELDDMLSFKATGYYAVNYIELIPIIVEALKEQKLENEQKQVEIDKLQKAIQTLNVKFEDMAKQSNKL